MKFRTTSLFILLIISISLIALKSCSKKDAEEANETMAIKALDRANMDTAVAPGEDFFAYANGGWMKNNRIPDDKSRYSAFDELNDANMENLKSLMEEAANVKAADGSIMKKIGDFYAAGMDTAAIEAAGITPLSEDFAKIDAIRTVEDIQNHLAYMHSETIFPMFNIFSGQDEKNSEMVITNLWQGGIGLPDRDYYVSEDARSEEIRAAYLDHLEKMFRLMGVDAGKAKAAAKIIMDIETRMAKASMTRLEMRDPHKVYNKMTIEELGELSSNINWRNYFAGIGVAGPGDINVGQPEFFEELSEMITDVSIDDWKTYLRWNLINDAASYLSSDFENQNFDFYGTVLSGKKQLQPRWKRVLGAVNGSLGEAVGEIYVKKYFPPEAKEQMLKLVGNLKKALKSRIENLEWMGDSTKQQALEKLSTINVKIGYPDKFRKYDGVEVSRDSYLKNIASASKFNFRYRLDKIGKPVDRDEWHMNPQRVNAYYSPNLNEIVFPAAILQYPFFTLGADDAVNYGAIGVVIGHELTHGFDDQGRKYDKSGNLNDWWTETDTEKFDERIQVLIDLYNSFTAIEDLTVDGKLTLGENIADLGGVTVAYEALHEALKQNPAPAEIDGFTPGQRFFLSYAQVWRQNIRDKELKRRLKEDVHSPGRFRTNGALMNFGPFYEAFNIKPSDKMYLKDGERAVIW